MHRGKNDPDHSAALLLPSRSSFVQVVAGFVASSARAFGLGQEEILKLRLAAEEIFLYLSDRVCSGAAMDVRFVDGMYYGRVEFRFPSAKLNLGALNITAAVRHDREEDLAQMGLVIASRSIDRLAIHREENGGICLALEKEKAYPPASGPEPAPIPFTDGLKAETPDTEGLKTYVNRVAMGPPDPLRPVFFTYPGQVVDRVAAGDCQVCVTVDGKGQMAGGILFRFVTERIVELLGVHVFDPSREREIAALLLDACIARTAKTKAVGLFSLQELPGSLRSQFECLGGLSHYRADGPVLTRTAYFRFLHEDPGSRVWSDPTLKDYLRGEYQRLFLAREIQEIRDWGETRTGASIFAADLQRERSEVVLRPLWPGDDQAENLKRHLHFLSREGFLNILFEIDLGLSWQASLVSSLTASGFTPAVLIPFAGQADRLVFQYHGTRS